MVTLRQEAKERTRQRLIEAAIEVLDEEGPSALTTVRITQRAGVAQPTFYVHFRDLVSGLEVAAEHVTDTMLAGLRSVDPTRSGTLREALERVLRGMLEDRRLTRIFLRHRRDANSPFGVRFQRLLAGAREHVVDVAKRSGAERPDVVAGLVVALVIGTLEGVLDGRFASADAALDDVTHAVAGMLKPPRR